MSIKENFMNEMIENQFRNMTSEEKKQLMEIMMERFFSSMTMMK